MNRIAVVLVFVLGSTLGACKSEKSSPASTTAAAGSGSSVLADAGGSSAVDAQAAGSAAAAESPADTGGPWKLTSKGFGQIELKKPLKPAAEKLGLDITGLSAHFDHTGERAAKPIAGTPKDPRIGKSYRVEMIEDGMAPSVSFQFGGFGSDPATKVGLIVVLDEEEANPGVDFIHVVSEQVETDSGLRVGMSFAEANALCGLKDCSTPGDLDNHSPPSTEYGCGCEKLPSVAVSFPGDGKPKGLSKEMSAAQVAKVLAKKKISRISQ